MNITEQKSINNLDNFDVNNIYQIHNFTLKKKKKGIYQQKVTDLLKL